MLETILTILIAYVLGVAFYTVIVRNNATHKYVPNVKLRPIIIDGAKGMAIGFVAVAAIYYLLCLINYLIV